MDALISRIEPKGRILHENLTENYGMVLFRTSSKIDLNHTLIVAQSNVIWRSNLEGLVIDDKAECPEVFSGVACRTNYLVFCSKTTVIVLSYGCDNCFRMVCMDMNASLHRVKNTSCDPVSNDLTVSMPYSCAWYFPWLCIAHTSAHLNLMEIVDRMFRRIETTKDNVSFAFSGQMNSKLLPLYLIAFL